MLAGRLPPALSAAIVTIIQLKITSTLGRPVGAKADFGRGGLLHNMNLPD